MSTLLHASEQAPSPAQQSRLAPGSHGQGLEFTVPGDPRGKGRPRATRRGKGIRLYTDEKTESYEALVAFAAHQALRGRDPLDVPLNVQVTVRLTPNASASKKERAAQLSGERAILGRFDLDNIVKAILDGCNKVAFRDDRQIVGIYALKVASEAAGVDVVMIPWAPQ